MALPRKSGRRFIRWRHHQAQITFKADAQQFLRTGESGEFIKAVAIKGISKEILMGDLSDFSRLPPFQLDLPFPGSDKSGTTF